MKFDLNDIRELFTGFAGVRVHKLDDRHFDIEHRPEDGLKILAIIQYNGLNSMGRNSPNNLTIRNY